ncbi:hypothetical protein D9M70_554320 [compost metagenome]
MAAIGPRRVDGAGDTAGNGDVVVLDQHRVVEPVAVVGATAETHGIFLECAQPRDGLAGAANLRTRMGDLVGEFRRVGRNTREMHKEVQAHPLGG